MSRINYKIKQVYGITFIGITIGLMTFSSMGMAHGTGYKKVNTHAEKATHQSRQHFVQTLHKNYLLKGGGK